MATARTSTVLWCLAVAAALGVCVAFMSTRGEPDVLAALGAVALGWITGGAAGLLWCAAAVGLGLWIIGVAPPHGDRSHARSPVSLEELALSGSVGAAVMLWIAHGLGVLGLLSGPLGMVLAWGIVIVGAAMLAVRLRGQSGPAATPRNTVATSWVARLAILACVPAVAVLIVGVCVPTGTLWESEARGYDSLSYHLALPKEWAENGRLWPLEHNAYSWLPSYGEAAYLHLAAMLGGAGTDGRWITACNALHAGLLVMTALVVASLSRAVARRCAVDRRAASWVGGAAALVTPWCVVTASLSYNEMGMLLGLGGACLACVRPMAPTTAAWKRGALIGLLLGVATACKPTAAFMGGPLVLLCMIAWGGEPTGARARAMVSMFVGAFMGGAVASLPWLARNALACGNPVFPSLTTLFGTAHWDAGQIERWSAAHHAPGGITDSASRLLSVNGVLHPQWSVFFFAATLGAVAAVIHPVLRRACWPLAAGLVLQLIAWMTIGHQQSRFLLPCVVTGATLLGVVGGLVACAFSPRVRWIGTATALVLVLWMSLGSANIFMRENAGAPARALVGGAASITGAAMGSDASLAQMDPRELARAFGEADNPIAACNRLIPIERHRPSANNRPPPLVYLLGDATPTYFSVPVLWNTVWDAWPLEQARAESPDDPQAWVLALRARGVTHVLVNFAEIERFRASGYSPPGMTIETARRLTERLEPVATWPRIGAGLYSLGPR